MIHTTIDRVTKLYTKIYAEKHINFLKRKILLIEQTFKFNKNAHNNMYKKINKNTNDHTYKPLPLQSSFFKGFILIIINGIYVKIPSCYLSMLKIFGFGLFFGLPFSDTILAYTNTGSVSLENLEGQLQLILRDLDRLLPQLNRFIDQFHNFIVDKNINVISDAQGALSMDVTHNLDDSIAQQYANRINVIDGLIRHHVSEIESLITRGGQIEEQIRLINTNYVSQLSYYSNLLSTTIFSYRHY